MVTQVERRQFSTKSPAWITRLMKKREAQKESQREGGSGGGWGGEHERKKRGDSLSLRTSPKNV